MSPSRSLKFILFTPLFIAYVGIARPLPPPIPGSSPLSIPIDKWVGWLQRIDSMPPEPYSGIVTKQQAGLSTIPSCSSATASPIGVQLARRTCYNSQRVEIDPLLNDITDQERLEVLRFYVLRFGVMNNLTPLTISLFSSLGGGSVSSGPDMINGLAARVRFRMYMERGSVNSAQIKTINDQFGDKVIQSARTANTALIFNYQRQLRLLDYLFPDAALWQMILVANNKI